MTRWLVSTVPLEEWGKVSLDTPLQGTRRGARMAAAGMPDAIGIWLGKVNVAGRGAARTAEIIRVWVLKRSDIGRQVRLFPRVCSCGEAFEASAKGRIPKKCPKCRGEGRRQFFREKAIARREAS